MRFLITGPLGHIGSRLIRTLPQEFPNSHITLVDDLSTQRYCSLFNLSAAAYEFHELDVASESLDHVISRSDVVIHLAAMTDAAGSLNRPELMARNLEGTRRVAKACARYEKPLLFSSSTSVYGTQKEVVDEACGEEDLKPQSPYAETKIREEQTIQNISSTQALKYVICRFGTICGTSPGMRFHTAVNKFCYQAVMRQPITVWRTAFDQRRPYLELGDCCSAVAHLVKTSLFDNSIYNVVTENTTVRGIVGMIQEHIPELSIEYVDSQIMNQLSYTVSADRFARTGFHVRGTLRGAIQSTIELLKHANGGASRH